jgi:hypothetical protein
MLARILFRRAFPILVGIWLGVLFAVGLMAAPTLFANLPRPEAGRIAGLLFGVEARFSLVLGGLLLLVRQGLQRGEAASSALMSNGTTMWLLAALFCTAAGHYGVSPWMEQAKAGQGPLSFAALHGISMLFFGAKALCVATLAWKLSPEQTS